MHFHFDRTNSCTLSALLVACCLMLTASVASAISILPTPHASETDLSDILTDSGYSQASTMVEVNATQTGAETFLPIGTNSNITLLIEDAGYRDHNELGIYSFSDNSLTAVIFIGAVDASALPTTLQFGAGGLEFVNGVSIAPTFGSEFGFYLHNADKGFTWYSETGLNDDGYQHFVGFEENNTIWAGFEDLRGGGDEDFNDLVFKMTAVTGQSASPIPEPSAALVFSIGLIVVAQSARKSAAPSDDLRH